MGLKEDAERYAADQAVATSKVFPGWAKELAIYLKNSGLEPIPVCVMTDAMTNEWQPNAFKLPKGFTNGWLIATDVSHEGHSADGFVVDENGGVWHDWKHRSVRPFIAFKHFLFVKNHVSRNDAVAVDDVYRQYAVAAVAAMTHHRDMQKDGIVSIPPNLAPPEED